MNAALVPVKRLAAGKSRLLPEFARDQLHALSLAMLGDVIEALSATPSLDRIAVVTPDAEVAATARAAGALALLRPDPGLNPALDAGAEDLGLEGDEPLLVVLGDVAGARPEDLEALFETLRELGGRGVVLAPSADGGTSALLRAPADAIPSRFGPQSAKAHREAAAEAGLPFRELPLASLEVDLDQPEDVARFLASGSGGTRTRALLHRLKRDQLR
jgi:2-phospho-L-lactate guanylyltransferase